MPCPPTRCRSRRAGASSRRTRGLEALCLIVRCCGRSVTPSFFGEPRRDGLVVLARVGANAWAASAALGQRRAAGASASTIAEDSARPTMATFESLADARTIAGPPMSIVLDHLVALGTGAHRLDERVEVDYDELERLDAEASELLHVILERRSARRPRRAPGCSVSTRPPSDSGKPVTEATSVTAKRHPGSWPRRSRRHDLDPCAGECLGQAQQGRSCRSPTPALGGSGRRRDDGTGRDRIWPAMDAPRGWGRSQ